MGATRIISKTLLAVVFLYKVAAFTESIITTRTTRRTISSLPCSLIVKPPCSYLQPTDKRDSMMGCTRFSKNYNYASNIPLTLLYNDGSNNDSEVSVEATESSVDEIATSKSDFFLQKSNELSKNKDVNWEAIFFMTLLAIQFGIQPGLVRAYAPQNICKSSFVLVQEGIKFIMASLGLYISGEKVYTEALKGWKISSSLKIAGIPAILYCMQNLASLMAYQNLQPLTYNVLNQTKTLSAALCCYLVIGRKQSKTQIVSLLLLLGSALIIEKIVSLQVIVKVVKSVLLTSATIAAPATTTAVTTRHISHGVLPILFASFLSGLAGALSQKKLQDEKGCGKSGGRNAYLFSMELNACSFLILLVSLIASRDGQLIRQYGFFHNWTGKTIIPIVTNAFGGIVVGLVTKYAGSVKKGFALIFGILISGLLQAYGAGGSGVEGVQVVGGALAALSLWLHTSRPYKDSRKVNDSSN